MGHGLIFMTNRSVLRLQGGYFFLMFFMISFTAVKAIANAIKYVILSTIKYNTPFHKGAETAATVSLHLTL